LGSFGSQIISHLRLLTKDLGSSINKKDIKGSTTKVIKTLSLTEQKTRFSKKINNLKLCLVAKKNSCNLAKAILNLKLSQKLSPQQIQLMKLIQLPSIRTTFVGNE
jgi:predicted O-linked N-acetylglucosamine transferase (SPINDLY family)